MTDNIFGHKPPAAMDLPDLDFIDDDIEDDDDELVLDLRVDWDFDYETMKFVDSRTGKHVIVDGELNPEIDFA